MPFSGIYVLDDGSIYPCCFAPDKMPPLGNANTDDVERVWRVGMEALRRQMLAGKMADCCLNCTMSANHLAPLPARSAPARATSASREKWVFSTPEREFLRLCAMAKPDWPAMIAIARTALSYGELRGLAGLHQLDGVVAWRLLDERMDGVAPNIVRQDCQRYLDHLDGQAGKLTALGALSERLTEQGVRYAIMGGPMQYAPLGIEHWPRTWHHFHIYADADSELALEEIAAGIDAHAVRVDADWWRCATAGIEIELWAVLPGELSMPWLDGDFETVATENVLGINLPRLSATRLFLHLARETYGAVFEEATRLPLWGLARLSAWSDMPDFSWNDALGLLEKLDALPSRIGGPSPGRMIRWTLAAAARVCGLAYDGPADTAFSFASIGRLQTAGRRQHTYSVYEWAAYPGDEAFIFDQQRTDDLAARLTSGIWQAKAKDHA